MPLTRMNEGFSRDLEGIAFGMLDEQQRPVRCLVTDAALTDAMGGNPTQEEQAEWFMANRVFAEEVASDKFDKRAVERDGSIRVDTQDLNPHLFSL